MTPMLRALPFCLLLALPAAAQGTAQGTTQPPAQPAPADGAMMTGMAAMNHAMSAAPMTGDPDRDFVAMMLPHHQGAVDMARTELRYGRDPALRRLARGIVAAQDREIATMRRWQASHRG